ncbi:electron transfer flavoprotein subunit alpha/FixB family protein [Bradymonadaceae bacterium TMQ3]|uniref:Electron transfer flavoprotein subunit alpha/FixB family protein n=1 Tax=Lujinxingia sediminis TaxID=2480984 RepID=A0ABY0CRX1_9DELT|nr:electron transfer flavoprotein subunit alpha/FixB family protein [Lujinxingia sediminis]RDV38247.1 electron transfer flavoprotein subunit alpha/FixB family protein [Bradymonadaceae bacterium TMQ3]RVU43554.1 electron transfer flavoprotein subunit alpha/FixB family protein [Lujinxingia sediminis]TXC75917.1 electron transfer flavoprotein subunit alpha/FixB family protein [Bradymonadales bacterium TMQ1]
MANVLVVAEHIDGKLRKVTLPTITFASQAAALTGGEVHVLVLGNGVDAVAGEVAKYGVSKVHYANSPVFENYLAETYAPAVVKAAQAIGATVVAAPSSTTGKDLLPRVAAKLDAGMVSDAIAVFDDGGIKFRRPLWAGNVLTTVEVVTPVKVVTVRTTDFEAPAEGDAAAVEAFDAGVAASDNAEFVSFDQVKSERPELTDAAVVVAGGRGLKSGENFQMIMDLADTLGGAVGASRAAVDSGYAPNDWQIGQTGKVVAPDLYFAVAISGAIQHLAGMKGSKTIVAINKDADAPIFQVADYGLVGDAFEIVPALTEKLKSIV